MTKIIVTHFNPDLDAIGGVWLLKRFDPEWQEAKVEFVPAGSTYNNMKPDEDERIIHIDTGLGKLDHHQLEEKTCATQLVFNYLKAKKINLPDEEVLVQLIKVICEIDHFGECLWPNATADYFNFNLPELLDGLKMAGKIDDEGLINLGCLCLDGVFYSLKLKYQAKEDLKKGYKFACCGGQAIACLSKNSEVLKLGQKMGYVLVVQKNPQTEHVKIKARPDSKIDLTYLKEKLTSEDPQATWFLHISKKMLLNGSTHNPGMRPTKLGLKKIINVIKSIYND